MPIYNYHCDDCKKDMEEFQFIKSPPHNVCSDCGSKSYHRVPSVPHTDLKEFHKPIEMYSVAVQTVTEARALKTACPDADISDNPEDPMFGVPIARSRAAKLQVLKASGFAENN